MHEWEYASVAQRTRRENAGRPLGRRALLWAAGLFLLSQGGLALVLAHDGYAVRDPARHARRKFLSDGMAGAPSAPKVVVLLGSSHVMLGARARQMSREMSEALGRPVVVNNQGALGGCAFRSLLAMDRLLREGVVPDLVVLETSPAFLHRLPTVADAPEGSLWRRTDAADLELLRRYGVDRADLGAGRNAGKLAPAYYFRGDLCNFLAPRLLPPERRIEPPPEEYPLCDFHEVPAGEWAKAVARVRNEYFDCLRHLSSGDPRQGEAVAELVETLHARGTRVVFLATPEGPTYRSWYPADRWAHSVAWLRDLAALHGVPLADARAWTGREDLFYDSHHLSREGSERFSRWLGREVLVPHLAGGR